MKLTPRLLTIANLVPKGNIAADIGTDHGYIPIYLIKEGIVNRVIAADVNEGPLKSAEKTIRAYQMESFIETRLGSGLQVLNPGEADVTVIAGMGGLLIRDILNENIEKSRTINTFILQPMVGQEELRRWLVNNQFRIVDEKLAKEDHRIYEIMVVTQGNQLIEDEIYYEISERLIENRDPLLGEFIEKHIRKYRNIIDGLKNQDSIELDLKRQDCEKKVEKLEEVLRCL